MDSKPALTERSPAERLRAETADAHREIEAVPRLARLMHPQLTREEYVAILLRFARYHAYLSQSLARWPAVRAAWEQGLGADRRGAALTRDVASVGDPLRARCEAPRETQIAAPSSQRIEMQIEMELAAQSEGEMWGALYVYEGSALGGALIARNLGSIEELRPATCEYFGGADSSPGPRWKNFVALLNLQLGWNPESRSSDEARCAAAIDGARRNFVGLARLMRD